MIDPIAEMLTKIRNAQIAGKESVIINTSNLKFSIGKILEKEGFVNTVSKERVGNFEKIKIALKYYSASKTGKTPAIQGIKRMSKEGQRIYISSKDIKKVKNGYGIGIISTSKGVMTNIEARQNGVGGEYLCEVW